MELIEIIKSIVTIVATVIAAIVAILGLKAWRKQLKGKVEYELARRILVAVYKYREAFAVVRNPAIFEGEANAVIKERENDKNFDPKDAYFAVYYVRWRKVNEAYSGLNVELLEAEALWGREIRDAVGDLFECEKKLFIAVRRHVDKRSKDEDDDILYDGYENDGFNKQIESALKKIENYLRKHLK